MKYSMVAINGKVPEPGKVYVRRVLISYTGKEDMSMYGVGAHVYTGTRLIDKDDYFNDATKPNQYSFTDDEYVLTYTSYLQNRALENESRKYHYFTVRTNSQYALQMRPIEFEADSDEEAIKKFRERDELR